MSRLAVRVSNAARSPWASRAWIWLGARRRKRRTRAQADLDEALPFSPEQEQLVRRYAPGRSFADIGCLHKAHGAVAFLAEEAGATTVTAFDEDQASPEFTHRRESSGSAVRYVSGDMYDPESMREVGRHDVVWCTGVMYHAPDPVLAIEALRSIAGEYLIIGNKGIPELPGFPGAAVYFPGLTERQSKAYEPVYYHGSLNYKEDWSRYSNTWWGLSESALRGMLEVPSGWVVEEIVRRPFTHRFDDIYFVTRRTPRP